MMDLNFSLHDAQMTIFQEPLPVKYKVVAAGRRFGKSFLVAVMLLIEALKEENDFGYDIRDKEVWYIAPTFNQGKDIIWNILKRLGADVIESTVENTATIRLFNGRTIKIKGSDRPDTLRGVGLSFVALDEYADMKPFVWDEILFPALTDVEGSAMFIGTPKGKNHFYDLFLLGQNDSTGRWKSWHFNTVDNPYLNKELITDAKTRLSKQIFEQEFEANFNAVGGNLFNEADIIYDVNEPTDGEFYIALDPAGFSDAKEIISGNSKRLDESAIAIVKAGTYGWWVKEIEYGRWGVRETALRTIRAAQKNRAIVVGIEKGSLGNAIMPYLEEEKRRLAVFPVIEPVTHGNQKKEERIMWALQGRFQHGRIKLCPGDWTKKFVEQLLDFPNPKAHDDLIDSLAYVDQIAKVSYARDIVYDDWEPLDLQAGY